MKSFLRVSSYFEELFIHHLPHKTNLGGFGYFNNVIQCENKVEVIKTNGRSIDFHHHWGIKKIETFFSKSSDNQLSQLADITAYAIEEISQKHSIEKEPILMSINNLKHTYSGFEEALKVSKTHKSKKIKVSIIRSVDLNGENIIAKIVDKDDEMLDEMILQSDTSIYDVSFDYRKSKWNNNSLEIFNRFGEVHRVINVQEYL